MGFCHERQNVGNINKDVDLHGVESKPHIRTTMLGHCDGVIGKARQWIGVQFPKSSCKLG